jgi:integrase
MDILGHSQIAVTMNIYAHVIPVMQQQAADLVNAALDLPDVQGEGDSC